MALGKRLCCTSPGRGACGPGLLIAASTAGMVCQLSQPFPSMLSIAYL